MGSEATEPNRGGSGQAAPAEDRTASGWRDYHAQLQQMTDVLQLDETQRAALDAAFQQQAELLDRWYEAKGESLQRYDRLAIEALREKNLSKARQLRDGKDLRRQLNDLLAARQYAIAQALAPQHRITWAAFQLEQRFLELAGSLELTAQQHAQVHDLAVQAATQVRDEPNPQAAGFIELEKRVLRQVFDESQSAAYQEIRKRNPLRSLQARPGGG